MGITFFIVSVAGEMRPAMLLSSSQAVLRLLISLPCSTDLLFSGYIVRNPLLSLFSIGALLIGIICGRSILKANYKNSRSAPFRFLSFVIHL